MAYQVIARKWRPQTFEEVTGQEAVTRTLRNAVQYERLHHAYLFSGARGVGKTTTARLLAKALNCHKTDKPNPKPCSPAAADACDSCKEIAEGRSIDVLEIDAASHTGIDDVRDTIIENININPARDRYKVFIIDEVHQLSRQAFNALLKTLEEPPPNVVFIMATTELHKVPDTILSRCQEFEFKTIALGKIFESLKNIAEVEKVTISDAALKEVARAGEGSMRDAQSAFDQVISFSGEKIEVEDVVNALGIAGVDILLRAMKGIAEHNTLEAFEIVEELTRRGHDLRSFCRDLLSFFRDLLVAKVAVNAEGLLDYAAISREELKKAADQFSEADLLRFFNSLADTEAQLRTATQPRYILEIGLVKLMEMRRVAPIEKLLEHLAALENGVAASSKETTPPETAASSASATSAPSTGTSPQTSEEKKTEFFDIDILLEETPAKTPPEIPVSKPAPTETIKETAPETVIQPPVPSVPPVFTRPRSTYSSAAASSSAAAVASGAVVSGAPLAAEDLVHIDDFWLDYAYERALLREGDDLSLVLTLDLSGLTPVSSQQPKFVPPPVPASPPIGAKPPETAKPSENGPQISKPVQTHRQKPETANLLAKFKAALAKDKPWLARAFDEISRISAGEQEIVFLLPEKAGFWRPVLESEENIETLRQVAGEILQKSLAPVIKIEGQNLGLNVPTTAELAKKRESAPEIWQAADEDPAVKQILSVFRGRIIDVHHSNSE